MGHQIKKDGRKVDGLIASIEWDISQAEMELSRDAWSPDPWKHIEAKERARPHLKKAAVSAREIADICLLARQRDKYRKNNE